MRAVIYMKKMEEMDGKQRRRLGQQWLYQAVAAFGIPGITEATCPVERTSRGKPFFPSCPHIHFSISHSRGYWACAVADQPVGLDLQYHKQGRLSAIPARFFHPLETQWLASQGLGQNPGEETGSQAKEIPAFFQVWTTKESYVKWTGQGIDRDFGRFCVVDASGLVETLDGAYFWRKTMGEFSLCLCGSEPWEQIIWKGIPQEEVQ